MLAHYIVAVFFILSQALASRGEEVAYTWSVSHAEAPHSNRTVINNVLRLPVVNVTYSDVLVVHITNQLDTSISLRLLGMTNTTTDTLPCLLAPGDSSTYRFTIEQSGTHYIAVTSVSRQHSSVLMRVPVIANDADEVFEYQDESVFLFEDTHGMFTVNGEQRLPRILMTPFWVYRVRLLNLGHTSVMFSMGQHELSLMEIDGIEYEPEPAHSVNLLPGQRLSAMVTAKVSNDVNYAYQATFFDSSASLDLADGGQPAKSADIRATYQGMLEYWTGNPTKPVGDWAATGTRLHTAQMTPMARFGEWEPTTIVSISECVRVKNSRSISGADTSDTMQISDTTGKWPLCEKSHSVEVTLKYQEIVQLEVDSVGSMLLWLNTHMFQVITKEKHMGASHAELRSVDRLVAGNLTVVRFRADVPSVWDLQIPGAPRVVFVEAADRISDTDFC
ncbi:hypothetical protein DL89DRAFT_270173 [Linderina pennispora]|uniref:Cupredoxin n=1 Tax=Linderina pennispora TaxID=61395 RepID=A0A1Y1VZF6_9FUNG|nr:uncharacterized protein DL89DRAFT_270173 [Linderina pennispora]ORX66648.1 hypothetical protein DL89DRAFT_270173 [Linderina pennispora]